MRLSRSTVALVLAVVATLGVAKSSGTWPFTASQQSADKPAVAVHAGNALLPLPPAVDGVRTLYDGTWTVEEGQWWVGNDPMSGEEATPSFRQMLESVDGGGAAYLTVPGFYGDYRATIQLLDEEPGMPSWCEDAAEVSLVARTNPTPFQVGGFEEFTDPVGIPKGSYRLRYCTEQQDVAATQDEFEEQDQYTIYAGRHLLQLWPAPREPDATVRTGSSWASVQLPSGG